MRKGSKLTSEQLAKRRKSPAVRYVIDKILPKSHLGKPSPLKGRKFPSPSEETRRKMSVSHMGSKHSEEQNQKQSEAMKGKPKSLAHRLHLNMAKRGSQHPNWKGGFTHYRSQVRASFKYRLWRSDVFTRDNFTCQNCGVGGGYLEAHHIKSYSDIINEYSIKNYDDAMNCEELWNINNGTTLCKDCYKLTDNYKGRAKKRSIINQRSIIFCHSYQH